MKNIVAYILLLFLLSMQASIASTLYSSFNNSDILNEDLYLINQSNASLSLIGNTGFTAPLTLASDWRSSSPMLWSSDFTTNQLLKINPMTGEATSIGIFNNPGSGSFQIFSHIRDLAFDTTSDRLFGMNDFGFLYEVDPNTAEISPISGLPVGDIFAMDFNSNGDLFMLSNNLQKMFMFDIDSLLLTELFDVKVNGCCSGFTAMAIRPEDDEIFIASGITDSLYTVDRLTGELSLVGAYGDEFSDDAYLVGLGFLPTALSEPSSFMLLLIGFTAVIFGRRPISRTANSPANRSAISGPVQH